MLQKKKKYDMMENGRLKEKETKNKVYTIRAEYFKLSDP